MLGWQTGLRLDVASGCHPEFPGSFGELGSWEKPLGSSVLPFGHRRAEGMNVCLVRVLGRHQRVDGHTLIAKNEVLYVRSCANGAVM